MACSTNSAWAVDSAQENSSFAQTLTHEAPAKSVNFGVGAVKFLVGGSAGIPA